MDQLTIKLRVLVVKYHIQAQSIAAVREAFRARFPNRTLPSKNTIVVCKNIVGQAPATIAIIVTVEAVESRDKQGKRKIDN